MIRGASQARQSEVIRIVLHLDLTAEAEARLRKKAAESGKEINRFVLDAVEEKLAASDAPPLPVPSSQGRHETAEEWIARFDAWVQSHPRRGYVADDSRESIYAGRGE